MEIDEKAMEAAVETFFAMKTCPACDGTKIAAFICHTCDGALEVPVIYDARSRLEAAIRAYLAATPAEGWPAWLVEIVAAFEEFSMASEMKLPGQERIYMPERLYRAFKAIPTGLRRAANNTIPVYRDAAPPEPHPADATRYPADAYERPGPTSAAERAREGGGG